MEPIKILVVDDFEQYRKVIRRALRSRGRFEIVGEASDGLEAVEKAGELRPDLILMDVHMPKLSGLEACRSIRKLSPKSKILFVTVDSSAEVLEEALRSGAHGCLHKLDVAGELFEAIDAIMEGELFASTHIEYNKSLEGHGCDGASARRCRDCRSLSALYQETVDEFRQLVHKLSQASISYERDMFMNLFQQCEEARQQCSRARDNLFGHLREQH